MISIHKPTLLALLETRMGDHKALADMLGFNSQIQFPASGNSGRIVIMWDSSSIGSQDISVFSQGIHVAVKVNSPPPIGSLVPSMLVITFLLDKLF